MQPGDELGRRLRGLGVERGASTASLDQRYRIPVACMHSCIHTLLGRRHARNKQGRKSEWRDPRPRSAGRGRASSSFSHYGANALPMVSIPSHLTPQTARVSTTRRTLNMGWSNALYGPRRSGKWPDPRGALGRPQGLLSCRLPHDATRFLQFRNWRAFRRRETDGRLAECDIRVPRSTGSRRVVLALDVRHKREQV